MKKKIRFCWIMLFIVYLFVPVTLGAILNYFWVERSIWIWLAVVVILLIAMIITMVKAATSIPHNQEANIEVFGAYFATWTAGLHFLFPFFGIMKIKDDTLFFKGEDAINLFDGPYKDVPVDKMKNVVLVDFKGDASVYLEAAVFFKVLDSKKAAYNVYNVFEAIKKKMEGGVITFFGDKTLDEANANKHTYNLVMIVGQDTINYIKDNWGVQIIKLAVDDFKLSPEDMEIRRKLFNAEKTYEEEKLKAKTTVIKAKAERDALQLKGKGFSEQVASLVAEGLSREEAINYLGFLHKWTEIGKKDQALIIDNNDGIAGAGAKFGRGFNIKK